MTRVTRLSTIPISVPLEPPKGGKGHPLGATFLTHCIVKIETDSGVVGYGEISDAWGCEYAKVADAIVTEALARFAIGQDPRDPAAIVATARAWLRRRQGTVWLISHALSGVEMALWDIAGKLADRPVHELLGGQAKPLRVYAGGNFLSQGTADVHHEHFEPFLAKGVTAAKVRLGAKWEEEIATLAALRRLFGPDIAIFIDGNEAFRPTTAARIAPRLAECGVRFFEEPCPRDDAAALARFVAAVLTPGRGAT